MHEVQKGYTQELSTENTQEIKHPYSIQCYIHASHAKIIVVMLTRGLMSHICDI